MCDPTGGSVRPITSDVLSCCWCDRPFEPRQTGGRMQRFCRPSCRRSFHAVVRTWALDAIADGTLSIEEIRSGAPATRALRRATGLAAARRRIAASCPSLPAGAVCCRSATQHDRGVRLIRVTRDGEMIAVNLGRHLRKQPFACVDHQPGAVHMRAVEDPVAVLGVDPIG